MRFVAGDTLQIDWSNIHCTVDNSTCYKVKTVPNIDSVSASQGYTSGGQLLTIKGHGFLSDSVSVKVAGADCLIKSKSKTQISCETSAVAQPTPSNIPQPGLPGLTRRIYNATLNKTTLQYSKIFNYPVTESLLLHFESPENLADYYAQVLSGYFKAPFTARYRFYMSCDDAC